MFKASCFALALLLFACSQIHNVQTRTAQNAIPTLTATVDTGKFQLKMSELHIKVETAGNIATTTFDITFFNPLDRVLEGEFEFPLSDGQNISSYALEMNGQLREGVVVEKMQARIAFENTVRRKIDPGLVEKTKGNNFKTRVYPIPANRTKRVVIGIEQKMDLVNGDYQYQLPLYAKELIHNFSIDAKVLQWRVQPDLSLNELNGFSFHTSGDDYEGNLNRENFTLNQLFAFSLPFAESSGAVVLTQKTTERTYFYVNSRIEIPEALRTKPHRLAILWDISASADKRNKQKEIEFLQQYVATLGSVEINLVPFNITVQEIKNFHIENGNTEPLVASLKNLSADGGTQLGCLDPAKYDAEEFLLFSDGLSTFGKKEFRIPSKPVMTINSSPSANYSYLKFIADETHGKFIDLSKLDISNALTAADQHPLKVIRAEAVKGDVHDIVTTLDVVNGTISIAGILESSSASIDIALGQRDQEIVTTKQFNVSTSDQKNYGNVKRIWASMKIDQLDRQAEKNKEDITALGKEFSIVTQYTSLLVLDRVEDYVQYEITPPVELQKEYFALLKAEHKSRKDEEALAFEEALAEMENLKQWWNRKFNPKKKTVITEERVSNNATLGWSDSTVELKEAVGVAEQAIAPPRVESYKFTPPVIKNDDEMQTKEDGVYELKVAPRPGTISAHSGVDSAGRAEPIIELREWKPNADYLQILEKLSTADQIGKYLELKKHHLDQPSFFVDVADFFFQRKLKDQALLVLSNIAEMKLEDAELLRIMAFRLREMNEMDLAIETFNDILKMRSEEPQSYRDLALAYSETGKFNEAIPLLYKLVTGTWDVRFHDVRSIALNELNAVISAHPGVDVSAIDKRFIYPMPVDVRIVIGWTSDNSDIDLWVTDPNREKCDYSHNETVLGGKLSQDVTQGYGPEEFCLKRAKKGKYVIAANLFGDSRQTLGGPITITADLFTNFGKSNQNRKTINFRVTTTKEVVVIGEMKI